MHCSCSRLVLVLLLSHVLQGVYQTKAPYLSRTCYTLLLDIFMCSKSTYKKTKLHSMQNTNTFKKKTKNFVIP